MPELPEVETIAAGLRPRLVGRRITGIRLLRPGLLRGASPEDLQRVKGAIVGSVRRRGKMLLVDCGETTLVFHLKMTGGFAWQAAAVPPDKHTHLVLTFAGLRRELRFSDVRKFGFLLCLPSSRAGACRELGALGPEPLETGPAELAARLRGRRGRLKSLLLDQRFLAGVGNIYADEALFAARLHPLRRAGGLRSAEADRLRDALTRVLRRAIRAGGSSIRDYRTADGDLGSFQLQHAVYGREGEACRACGAAIRRIVVGGRSSFFCPACQRPPRRPARSRARL